eukprot:CAMPEP_0181228322 /NCGR_PEP_ID=MMETSP1096-20121128/33286_1 /TAXON_ID=156174 ORGANISM="Chrysochromulina ericina, Strain CCMP281" /NCGR_SAMPLE_ID=MMETSP1096 /ASSEMBLY_ACC=CAM_ASM_000453 /LENGTH=60 /DNA_ID=CAMNT_0023321839 /DNA_START=76 /DNA_END=259 /DNA_ORIENTATION=-
MAILTYSLDGSKAVTNVTDYDKSLQLIDDASRRCVVKVGDGSCHQKKRTVKAIMKQLTET